MNTIEDMERTISKQEVDRLRLKAEIAELVEAIKDAREMVGQWAGYTDEYFREKWGVDGDIAKLDAAIAEHDKYDNTTKETK